MNYIYDGTFDGFLCCVYLHYHREKAEGIFSCGDYQLDLARQGFEVVTNPEDAITVYEAINDKISPWDLERAYRVFRTSIPGKEMLLLNYIRLGFKYGPRIRLLHSNEFVLPVEKADRKLGNEVHRLCGLIRFSVMEAEPVAGGGSFPMPLGHNILYAVVEPDHDVLEFLAPHFTDRFKWDPFIIHDKNRKKALAGYGGKWYITEFSGETSLKATASEEEYRGLWRNYFDSTAIKERTNPRCQRSFMPLRYWKNLTEVNANNGIIITK